ncbi:MAG: aminotransferase class V-fold PLP-dependent enzyme [Eggerthellaceae bacterium]|jgi:threonine aldolase|nr:aminotransferase class V-fold PLP-dependent enzyme [Eggerthellaceae bacterium]MDR2715180.1 aminotransferase class V-fold PLP-dependent enzyme [Coriobacteriaceae bacterium]
MLHFDSDYMEGAHPRILERLVETNLEQTPGYGNDDYCASARKKIKRACNAPYAQVFFLVGGTQTNATVIDAILKPWEGVLAAQSGHINTHEAGAIEATGHKILELPHDHGKVTLDAARSYLETFHDDFTNDHMVRPGMIYISHPTEYGTLYTKKELAALRNLCHQYNMALYLDGARLGYGLAARGNKIGLEDIARFCDAFYIGGTKVGALFGEAVVLTRADLCEHFFTLMKQHGAVLAKGRLLGIQFDTLFTEKLYYHVSLHAVAMAEKLRNGFVAAGHSLYLESPTNQQFIILENSKMEELAHSATFEFWELFDENRSVVRFVTSWATREEDVDALIALL